MTNVLARILHDKLLHYAVGSVLTTLVLVLGGGVDLAAFVVVVAAILREVYNLWRGGAFSVADVIATVAGFLPLAAALHFR